MMQGCLYLFGILLLLSVVLAFFQVAWPLMAVAILVVLGYKLYEHIYFNSTKFGEIKNRIADHIRDCNELNEHIESLKNVQLGTNQAQYGHSDYHDNSTWNFRRKELKKIRS